MDLQHKILKNGFTLIELVVTMVIVAGLISASVLTLRGYIPKQRLISATDTVEKAFSQAQYEATSRALWSCVVYDQAMSSLNIYMDANSDRNCNNNNDYLVGTHQFNDDITFPNCAPNGDGNPFDQYKKAVWFNTAGEPNFCDAPPDCSKKNIEVILSNSNLPSTNRSREVEISMSGLIEIVPRGEKGYNATTYARTPVGTTSVNACE